MIKIVALEVEHILAVQLQQAQAYAIPIVTAEHAHALVQANGVGWAALDDDGNATACAGIIEMHQQRGMAWALISEAALKQFKTLHRVISAVVRSAPWKRIEMTVDSQHTAGIAWAERLGFKREGLMTAYTPDGRDCFLYAKVK
ncbi:GNAT family acetyltransferase [Paenalcaligenes suwonensis]|uniref:GNAT family acetyltransferase n=1 Tax=Paenalcaligenes suwonensis TaxID=1202713 RepID=UPI001F61BCEC|nr:GNAT family acetyltransferase [Paenalcaligenes suwonensis]